MLRRHFPMVEVALKAEDSDASVERRQTTDPQAPSVQLSCPAQKVKLVRSLGTARPPVVSGEMTKYTLTSTFHFAVFY